MTYEILKKYNIKDTDILDQIVNAFNIVGETNNKKILFLSCISKDLPSDLHISSIVISRSSAGKSYLVKNILSVFQKDVLFFTNATESFQNRTFNNTYGKIIFKEQLETKDDKGRLTLENLKFLLSEGEIKTGISDKIDGQWTPKVLENFGKPVFITTSTNPNIDTETINRLFVLSINESEKQTKQIVSNILEKHSNPKFEDSWNNKKSELIELVKVYEELAKQTTNIMIPFLPKIYHLIPTSNHEIRRDIERIINICKLVAFSHSANRIRIRDNQGKTKFKDQYGNTEDVYSYIVIAEPQDMQEALDIGSDVIKQTLNKIDLNSQHILDIVKELDRENNHQGVTVNDVSKKSKLSPNRIGEIMRNFVYTNFLRRIKESREYLYFVSEKKVDTISFDKIDFTKDDLEKWFNEKYDTERYTLDYPN